MQRTKFKTPVGCRVLVMGWLGALLLFCSASVLGVDRIVVNSNPNSLANDFSMKFLKQIMEVTVEEYGDYEITASSFFVERGRLPVELIMGVRVNVAVVPPKKEMEGFAIRVPIPVDRGIGSYRIGIVEKSNIDRFKDVAKLDQLKRYSHGVVKQWTTARTMEKNGFNVVYGINKRKLAYMVAAHRFDLFPRGVNEIFIEVAEYQKEFPSLVVEPHVAVFTYLPNYYYVSPKNPTLAIRIENGMRQMVKSGQYKKMFDQRYGQALRKSRLSERIIFQIPNPNIPTEYYEQDKPYIIKFSKWNDVN